jgi:hypothetical protein
MSKLSEIEDWHSRAIGYWNLAAQAGTKATRSMLEDLARETEAQRRWPESLLRS